MMTCKQCGWVTPDGKRVCGYCGYPIPYVGSVAGNDYEVVVGDYHVNAGEVLARSKTHDGAVRWIKRNRPGHFTRTGETCGCYIIRKIQRGQHDQTQA